MVPYVVGMSSTKYKYVNAVYARLSGKPPYWRGIETYADSSYVLNINVAKGILCDVRSMFEL